MALATRSGSKSPRSRASASAAGTATELGVVQERRWISSISVWRITTAYMKRVDLARLERVAALGREFAAFIEREANAPADAVAEHGMERQRMQLRQRQRVQLCAFGPRSCRRQEGIEPGAGAPVQVARR